MRPILLRLATEGDAPEDDDWLAPKERERLAALRLPKRRNEWRLGRWVAKNAVAAWLDIAPARVEVRPAADGAPEAWVDGAPAPLVLSLSHRAGCALAAVAEAGVALGCDLERIEPRSAAFVRDYLTAAERAAVARDPTLYANLVWSLKEATLKALRTGLRLDTKSVEVTLHEGSTDGWHPAVVHRHNPATVFHGWWRREGDLVVTVVSAPQAPPPPWRD